MQSGKSERDASRGSVRSPVSSWLVGIAFMGVLGMAILRVATGRPEWIDSWLVTAIFLLFGCVLVLGTYLYGSALVGPREPALVGLRVGLLFTLLLVVLQSATPGYGLGIARSIDATVVFLILVAGCLLAVDPRRYTPGQWLFVACFAIVTGILFFHSVGIGEASPRARHPLWWGGLVGLNLLVLPRFVSTRRFLWTLTRLSALLVGLALALAVGFAAHQLFEAYTLFQTGMGSVLATLAVGFLLFGEPDREESESAVDDDSAGDDEDASARTRYADYVGTEDDAPRRTPTDSPK